MSEFDKKMKTYHWYDPISYVSDEFEEFDLNQIYASIASYKGLPFPIGIGQLPAYKLKQWDYRMSLINGEDKDMYGRPVVMPVQIEDIVLGSGRDDGRNITLQPMVLIDGKKKIVKNHIGGGTYAGTVKEFINYDDYKIKIVGAVVSRNQKQYPLNQVQILKDLWKQNRALAFQSAITDDLFDYIVIEKIKFKELSMSPGIQMYEIEALSDSVIEVEQLWGDANDANTVTPGNYTTDSETQFM